MMSILELQYYYPLVENRSNDLHLRNVTIDKISFQTTLKEMIK